MNKVRKGKTMSKAKNYIRDYTKRCSNAVEDCNQDAYYSEGLYQPWLTPENALAAVEIARQEVIEKAVKFLDDNLYDYSEDSGRVRWGDVHATIEFDTVERFIEQFKQAMEKGE